MKLLLNLILVALVAFGGKAAAGEHEPDKPLITRRIDVGSDQKVSIKIDGINSRINRTSRKDVMLELFVGEPNDRNRGLEAEFLAKYEFTVNKEGNLIDAQLKSKPGVNALSNLKKWLIVHLPQDKTLHVKTDDKMYFGVGFPVMSGSHSGTADFEPINGVSDKQGSKLQFEGSLEGSKSDSGLPNKITRTTPAGQSNSSDIAGAWQIDDGDKQHVLIIQDGFFFHSFYTKADKNFISTQGGTYTIENQRISAKIYFDTENKEIVGKYLKGHLSVNQNTMKLSINRQKKDWERLDNGSAPLAGIWKLTARMQGGKVTPIHASVGNQTYKIVSGTRFHWATINPQTKEFLESGGGTYTFTNGKCIEHTEFASGDSSRTGASLTFDVKLEHGEWHQIRSGANGENTYEIWTKVKENGD